jgi:integrase/recombinase XerD
MTLSDAIGKYVDLKQSMGMRFRSERYILKALHRHVGEVDLTEVSTEAVATFLAGRGPVTATWLNKHRALRRFYEHWITRGQIIRSPVPTAVPRVAQNVVPHIYSNDELRRLLAAGTRRDRAVRSQPLRFICSCSSCTGPGCASVRRCT